MNKLQTFLRSFGKRYAILTPIFNQPEIRPVCNIARTAGTFLSLPILGGTWNLRQACHIPLSLNSWLTQCPGPWGLLTLPDWISAPTMPDWIAAPTQPDRIAGTRRGWLV